MSKDLANLIKANNFMEILLNTINSSITDKFVTPEFKKNIKDVVRNFFPKLNDDDTNVIQVLTVFVVDLISFKYNFDKNNQDYVKQWTQNDNRDIKGVILLLLPFIDDKNDGYLLKKLTDLNQLLYSPKGKKFVPEEILEMERTIDFRSTHFEFGNMGMGLLGFNDNKTNLLDLYDKDGNKLIYSVIQNNFVGLLKTLEIINGKSYINWVNISPLNLQNYIDSSIFTSSNTMLSSLLTNQTLVNRFEDFERNLLTNYAGLWFGDFYNIIRIKYYQEAKPIKWLIFPYEVASNNKIYLVQGLNKIFNLDKINQSKYFNYNDLEDDDKSSFKKRFKKIVENLTEKNSIITGLINIDIEIIKYFIIYLINNYSDKSSIKGSVTKKFKFNTEEQDEKTDDFDKKDMEAINNLTQDEIVNCLKEIYSNSLDHAWNYLKESLNMLKHSPYGKFIIKDNKITNSYYWEPFNEKFKQGDTFKNLVKDKLNLKNIYNIAKSLSHDNTKSWNLLDENYISLDTETKKAYFNKLNGSTDVGEWINLNSNLKRQIIYTSFNYSNEIQKITTAFSNSLIILVFEELASTGLLNKFESNIKITDKMLLPKDTGPKKNKRKELMKELFAKNKKDWLESYYYLTNDQFKNLGKIRVDKSEIINPKDKYNEFSYFDFTKDQEWPVFYAMDWISQISFFQHYIYHQVLYVTGATGQGKSTQVPKLLLYALKAIDYKSNGKVACTQPRVPPTVENATRIADELGVPIQQTTNNSAFKAKTNNYWLQYKYQNDFHTNDKKLHGYLRIMTDGTLLEELKSNPTMFKKAPDQKEDKFINKTIYDIIIVDEAHEHNINMDLIITLSKQACYFNNKVRLIIVSATMDDDEPIYRRYFSMINDNLLYPLKQSLVHPFFGTPDFLPIPEYMDRRYHISPPGETTQYRVDEYYLDNDLAVYKGNSIDERATAKEAQELGYRKVLEICSKSPNGEVLFFANGKKEILDATEYLNNNLPPGDIALPYFAELNETYKGMISKIDVKISQIKNKRENIHNEWGEKYVEDVSIPSGIYKRAIIIATNVAEASVTIPRLAFVVDNGYSKVNTFNQEVNITNLEVQKISEASRVQRRGRVGRIGDGTVYYMYKRDGRKNIKPKYKITQEDLAATFLNLLCDKDINDINKEDGINMDRLIVSDTVNPNYQDSISDLNLPKDNYTTKSGLLDIYRTNYWINRKAPDSKYWFMMNKGRTILMDSTFFVFNSGQIVYNLFDINGNYYLIHPFENSIKRNVLNQIIEFNNRKMSSIKMYEYRYIVSFLFSKGLILDANADMLYNYFMEVDAQNRQWVKSELGQKVSQLSSKFMMSIPDLITIISSAAMNCLTEVIEIKIMLEILGSNFAGLSNIEWTKFKSIYKNPNFDSDIIFIYEIIKKIKYYFSDLLTFTTNQSGTKIMIEQHFDTVLKNFKQKSRENDETTTDFDGVLWNKLATLKNNGKLDSDSKKVLLADSSTSNIFHSNLFKKDNEINKWAETNYFNPYVIKEFIKRVGDFYLTKYIFEDNEVLKWATGFNSNFMKNLTTGKIEERIIRSWIYGRPYNFTYSIEKSDVPFTFMNYNFIPIMFETRPGRDTETLTNLSSEFIFYLNYSLVQNPNIYKSDSIEQFNISFLSKIDLDWLVPAVPMFVNPRMVPKVLKMTNTKDEESQYYFPKSDSIQRVIRQIINNWNKNKVLWYSDSAPIMRDFYNKITKVITTNNK